MPIAVWLVTSSSSEGLINADRFLGRTGLTSGMSCMFADNCSRSANCLARSIRLPLGFALQSKHAPVRIADPFIMFAQVIGSFGADNALIRDNHTVTIKTFFSSALDTSSAADHPSKRSSANRLRALVQQVRRAAIKFPDRIGEFRIGR